MYLLMYMKSALADTASLALLLNFGNHTRAVVVVVKSINGACQPYGYGIAGLVWLDH